MSTIPTTPAPEEKQKPPAAAAPLLASGLASNASDDPSNALPEELAANLDQEKAPKDKKWFARGAFHFVNFAGLHFLFNSTLSLFIAYNLLPTKAAKSMMNVAAKIATPFNAAWMTVTKPIKKMIQGKAFKELSEAEMKATIAHSARSRVETAFMCIAGFVALWPVKYFEDHRAGFINFVDNLVHPGRSREEREKRAIRQEDEPKETWTNLIRARGFGLGMVFATDAVQQRVNNWLGYGKGNIDTAVWKWGARTSDKMNKSMPGVRSWLVNFFSRKNITLSGIQTHLNPENDMRGHLLKNIGAPGEMIAASRQMTVLQDQIARTSDKGVIERLSQEVKAVNDSLLKRHPNLKPHLERAIFAEQSRLLLTKEIFLTLVVSASIYTAAKAPFMARFFEKIGLKKKPQPEFETPPEALKEVAPEAGKETRHADTVKPRKETPTPPKAQPEQFTERHPSKTAGDWKASVARPEAENHNLAV